MLSSVLVLDANIIIRSVLGNKVRNFIIEYNTKIDFITPDACIDDAEEYLPIIFKKKGLSGKASLDVLKHIKPLFQIIEHEVYQERMIEAKERMRNKDLDDWPVVATALLFNCPIWTEDKDFFGVGVPTWTTDRIHILFNSVNERLMADNILNEPS